MSDWTEVLRAPLDQDLSALSQYLQAHEIPTWIFEQNGEQCLCVPATTDPLHLQGVILQWQTGRLDGTASRHGTQVQPGAPVPTIFAGWQHFRLTLLLVAVSLVTFLMVGTQWGQSSGGLALLAVSTLQPIEIQGDNARLLAQLPPLGQWWRFWTPIFLHFSFFHILFNGLMMLELGRRIETRQGSTRLFWLVLVCALVSNLAQFFASPANVFGGLSGVVYALIGYGWLYQRLRSDCGFLVAPGLMAMALVWQALCFSGVVTLAGLGNIANAAHIAGLAAGLLLAWVVARFDGPTAVRADEDPGSIDA